MQEDFHCVNWESTTVVSLKLLLKFPWELPSSVIQADTTVAADGLFSGLRFFMGKKFLTPGGTSACYSSWAFWPAPVCRNRRHAFPGMQQQQLPHTSVMANKSNILYCLTTECCIITWVLKDKFHLVLVQWRRYTKLAFKSGRLFVLFLTAIL